MMRSLKLPPLWEHHDPSASWLPKSRTPRQIQRTPRELSLRPLMLLDVVLLWPSRTLLPLSLNLLYLLLPFRLPLSLLQPPMRHLFPVLPRRDLGRPAADLGRVILPLQMFSRILLRPQQHLQHALEGQLLLRMRQWSLTKVSSVFIALFLLRAHSFL